MREEGLEFKTRKRMSKKRRRRKRNCHEPRDRRTSAQLPETRQVTGDSEHDVEPCSMKRTTMRITIDRGERNETTMVPMTPRRTRMKVKDHNGIAGDGQRRIIC